jgi:predicted peptidase
MITGLSPITGIPSGATQVTQFPVIYTKPANESVKNPLLVFLHGAGEGSPNGTQSGTGTHNTSTVLSLDNGTIVPPSVNNVGPLCCSRDAALPTMTDPIRGTTHNFYQIAPQLKYYTNGADTTGSTTDRGFGYPWPEGYVLNTILWALANFNVDISRIYLTGLSLGGGGTLASLMNNNINKYIAAAWAICPGYGNASAWDTTIRPNLAKCGVPVYLFHALNDTATNPSGGELVSSQVARKHNTLKPLRAINYVEFTDGGHGIWNRFYRLDTGNSYTRPGLPNYVYDELFYETLLRHKRGDFVPPYYP